MMQVLVFAAVRTVLSGLLVESAFRLFRIQHPVVRKAVWGCVLAVGFAMPLLQTHALLLRLPISSDRVSGLGFISTSFVQSNTAHSLSTTDTLTTPASAGLAKAFLWHFPSRITLLLCLYLLVSGILLLRTIIGLIVALRIVRKSAPIGLSQLRSVRVSSSIQTPWTFGSSILLPVSVNEWSDEQLRLVLAHEKSHVEQFDFYLQLGARIYTAIFWFSPLGWWLQRECERLGEQTSDCAALAVANDAVDYADILLRFSTSETLPAVCMARRSGLKERIETILTHGSLNLLFDKPGRAMVYAVGIVLFSVAAGNLDLRGQATDPSGLPLKPTVPYQTFDVIVVKPNKSVNGNMSMHFEGTTLYATNVSLQMLLMNAYGIRPDLMSGLPKWAESDRYDIVAKVSEPNPAFTNRKLSEDQSEAIWHAKMQAILTDKFHLKAHDETVTGPVYDLVLVSGGPKFKVSQVPESQEMINMNNNALEATHVQIKSLCASLASTVARNIIDKTGLTGDYDMKLAWTPAENLSSAKESGITDPPPDIYTALKEQLGLKLVPAKGPIQKLVVDSIEEPAPN